MVFLRVFVAIAWKLGNYVSQGLSEKITLLFIQNKDY